jgi:hypothetical protein
VYYDPNQRPDEDFGQWNDRNRIAKQRYEEATNQNQPAQREPFNWGTPSGPFSWGGGGGGGGGGGSGGGGGGGAEIFAGCMGAIVLLPAVVAFGCLYPMPIMGGLVTGVVVSGFLAGATDRSSEAVQLFGVILLPIAVGLATFVGLSRLDHWMGRSILWRLPRHVARLALFGIVGHWVGLRAFGESRTLYPNPMLRNPLYVGGLCVFVALVSWILTRRNLRESWHERLESIGLRKATSAR